MIEPAHQPGLLQAVFQVSLDFPSGHDLKALSNTAPIANFFEGQVARVVFAPSPLMSSYLLAVCVGRLRPLSNGEPCHPAFSTHVSLL